MRTARKSGILLSIFLLLAVGCAAGNEAKAFLPLTPGNIWTYDVDIQGEKVEMHVEAGQPKNVEGKNTIPLSYSYSSLALPTQIEYYSTRENAIVFPRIDNVQGQYLKKPILVFLKFPLKKGAKWEWSGKLVPMGSNKTVVQAKVVTQVKNIESVLTPAGNYKKAFKISFVSSFNSQGNNFVIKEERWYVKEVGMVKEVLYDDQGEEVLVALLKKFRK